MSFVGTYPSPFVMVFLYFLGGLIFVLNSLKQEKNYIFTEQFHGKIGFSSRLPVQLCSPVPRIFLYKYIIACLQPCHAFFPPAVCQYVLSCAHMISVDTHDNYVSVYCLDPNICYHAFSCVPTSVVMHDKYVSVYSLDPNICHQAFSCAPYLSVYILLIYRYVLTSYTLHFSYVLMSSLVPQICHYVFS